MKNRIVGGMTQQHYHTIPSDIDLITTNPTKQGIFYFLAQIGYDKFPEFVTDILTKVEHHTLIDITDGQGDEKQDILTLTPDGKRCLTQCKHSTIFSNHYNGDDLDNMVTALLRKDCRQGILVTNTDLTPQGKKYVNDQEYLRGWPDKADPILVDYRNDIKIWERIKNNTDILNKWFSGLGQTHGLRNFKFDITIQKLPYDDDEVVSDNFEEILKLLTEREILTKKSDLEYFTKLESGIELTLSRWFQFTNRLDIPFVLPNDNSDFLNSPLYALTIEVSIPNAVKYSPTEVRKQVIDYLLNDILPGLSNNSWWHITSSQTKSFIFLHDISETRQVTLNSAETFVKINEGLITSELEHVSLSNADFTAKVDEDESDESIWTHNETGIEVILLFDQKLDPYHVYEHQMFTLANIEIYKTHSFRAVTGIDNHLLMRVRKILPHGWVAIQQNEDTLIWGVPPEAGENEEQLVTQKMEALHLTVLHVKDEDKEILLSEIKKDNPPATYHIVSELSKVTFPIDLPKRIYWLQKSISLSKQIDYKSASKLLTYKYAYENQHGFDNMFGKTEVDSHTSELPHLLADIMTIRGKRMFDIGVRNNPYSLILRFYDDDVQPTNELIALYITEFQRIYDEVENLLIEELGI